MQTVCASPGSLRRHPIIERHAPKTRSVSLRFRLVDVGSAWQQNFRTLPPYGTADSSSNHSPDEQNFSGYSPRRKDHHSWPWLHSIRALPQLPSAAGNTLCKPRLVLEVEDSDCWGSTICACDCCCAVAYHPGSEPNESKLRWRGACKLLNTPRARACGGTKAYGGFTVEDRCIAGPSCKSVDCV